MKAQSPAASHTRMFGEAAQAPSVIARQLSELGRLFSRIGNTLRAVAPHAIVTCARGSSDHAATFAKYLIETKTGIPTASAAPSIITLYQTRPKLDGVLFIVISQSGRSPDLLAAAQAARSGGAYVVVLVNDAHSPLANLADEIVPLCAGPELSVAATKSYIAALGAITAIVAAWTRDESLAAALEGSPGLLDRAWGLDWSPLVEQLRNASSLYVIGRGMGFGIAQEAALKLKETCQLHAEAFSAAEVRHGPMALVRPGFPVLVFRQPDETEAGVDGVIADLVACGAEVLVAGPGAGQLPIQDSHPVLAPLLQIQSFYRAANALSLARGLDPDKPPNLAKVTETI